MITSAQHQASNNMRVFPIPGAYTPLALTILSTTISAYWIRFRTIGDGPKMNPIAFLYLSDIAQAA